MMMSAKPYSQNATRDEKHLRLLEKLECLPLTESCCEICHCDCYSSHRSSELNANNGVKYHSWNSNDNNNNNNKNNKSELSTKGGVKGKQFKNKSKKEKRSLSNDENAIKCYSLSSETQKAQQQQPKSKSSLPQKLLPSKRPPKRSKSACNIRDRSAPPDDNYSYIHYIRDCKILQDLLTTFEDTSTLKVLGKSKYTNKSTGMDQMNTSNNKNLLPLWSSLQAINSKEIPIQSSSSSSQAPLKLCESMANLCLTPVVRQAFQRVPSHDKKILNRMATKRSEKVLMKENAWLARKYWENERYERELLKCEQMEEYKRAVHDKQFQDYLMTKERLNELAQRDLAELENLRKSLKQKDVTTKRRLEAIRVERDIQICQRRCDELGKNEAATVQQEEKHLDDVIRRQVTCDRLTERLHRADQVRSQILECYLKRLRYDNYIEQLVHEENWRETKQIEILKREQLKEHISRKRTRSQRFVENRQRRNEAINKTAKISASLRELVRNSVTPETALIASNTLCNVPITLERLLYDKPFQN